MVQVFAEFSFKLRVIGCYMLRDYITCILLKNLKHCQEA